MATPVGLMAVDWCRRVVSSLLVNVAVMGFFWAFLYLLAGCGAFFLARWTWQWEFGYQPIRVKTLVGCFLAMWLLPGSLLMAAVSVVTWLIEHKSVSWWNYVVYDARAPSKRQIIAARVSKVFEESR